MLESVVPAVLESVVPAVLESVVPAVLESAVPRRERLFLLDSCTGIAYMHSGV